ncbi:MAG: class I SAM-dependent methyltransferase [Bacteroidia bacterium]
MNKTKIAVDIFNKKAKDYQDRFMDVSLYGSTFDYFCEAIKPNAEVLELACGPGNITRYLLNKRPDLRITGIDLAPDMIALAKQNNPEAGFHIMDCREIASLNKTVDAVMCGFCLPYLEKEEAIQLIRDASTLLHPKGVIYISTMEDDYGKSGLRKGSGGEEMYIHYHEAGYLTYALKENQFEILKTDRKNYTDHTGTATTDLILIAAIKAQRLIR